MSVANGSAEVSLTSRRFANLRSARVLSVVNGVLSLALLPRMAPELGVGLDPSWAAAVAMAADRRMVFGQDLVFTYGPLGFLASPQFAVAGFGVVSMVVRAIWICAFGWLMTRALLRRFRWPLAFAVAWLITWFMAGLMHGAEALLIPQFLLLGGCLDALLTRSKRSGPSCLVFGGVAAGTLLNTKFDVGVTMTLALLGFVVAEAIIHETARSRAITSVTTRFATVVASGFGSVLAWRLVFGQPLSALSEWLSSSVDVLSGYDRAMVADYGRRNDRLFGYAVAFLIFAAILAVTKGSNRRRLAALLFTMGALALFLKQSFTRHDNGHGVYVFALAAVFAVVIVGSMRSAARGLPESTLSSVQKLARRHAGDVAASVAFAIGLGFINDLNGVDRPTPGSSARVMGYVLSASKQADVVRRQRPLLQKELAIPASMLVRLRARTMTVLPSEASVVWAHGELAWKPLPVFQSYVAYTASLDERNAKVLRSRSGPDFVLFEATSIDGRVPRWESPEAMLALLCRYSVVERSPRWQLFQRRTDGDACAGAPLQLGTTVLRVGESIEVEEAPAGYLVVARFRGLKSSGIERIIEMVTRPAQRFVDIGRPAGRGARPGRFVIGTAGHRHVVALPQCVQGAWSSFDTQTFTRLGILGAGDRVGRVVPQGQRTPKRSGDARYSIELEAIPYECPPTEPVDSSAR